MKPTVQFPVRIRGLEYGGPQPLFCIPLVAGNLDELTAQADIARGLKPELVEWRADFFKDPTESVLAHAANVLRTILPDQAVIFTLRIGNEGGVQEMPQAARHGLIEAVLRSRTVDIVDLELANDPAFLDSLMGVAGECGVRTLLAFHDFAGTPGNDLLLDKISVMHARRADIAKIAVMPRTAEDVLRLFPVTITARRRHPSLPLVTMSMGALGSISRVAGFLYGSDMSFAVGKEPSAPGQVPMEDARRIAEMLLQYS